MYIQTGGSHRSPVCLLDSVISHVFHIVSEQKKSKKKKSISTKQKVTAIEEILKEMQETLNKIVTCLNIRE